MNKKIAYFRNGVLYNVFPRNTSISLYDDRGVAYDADTVIVSDNGVYDPVIPQSINSLRIPCFNRNNENVVFDLSYIIKMRCNMITDPLVLPIFISKTLDLMEASPIEWRRGDYLRVICNFYENGLFVEGDRFEAAYRALHKTLFSNPLDYLQEAEHLSTKYYFEDKWRKYQEYYHIKSLFPDIIPATVKGYLQIRTRQTKRFLQIKELAEKQGFIFHFEKNCHYCRKFKVLLPYIQEYDHTNKYSVLKKIQCIKYVQGQCTGIDEFGLSCVYPR